MSEVFGRVYGDKGARIEIEDLRENVPDRDGSGGEKNANSKKSPPQAKFFEVVYKGNEGKP